LHLIDVDSLPAAEFFDDFIGRASSTRVDVIQPSLNRRDGFDSLSPLSENLLGAQRVASDSELLSDEEMETLQVIVCTHRHRNVFSDHNYNAP